MANEEQIRHWNEDAGPRWVEAQTDIDHMIAAHARLLLERAAPAPRESVLDVGCGTGATTVELAARVRPGGRVVGVDVSGPMLRAARERAGRTGVEVELREADVQTTDLGTAEFDLLASRFGVMFFDDPLAAFRNLHAAVRPHGRFVFLCWQSVQVNPWVSVPMSAVARHLELPPPQPGAPGPFALADRDRTERLLSEAGWRQIEIESFEHAVSFGGHGVEAAIRFLQRVGPLSRIVAEVEEEALRETILDSVRNALEQHVEGRDLQLGSAAWVVGARA